MKQKKVNVPALIQCAVARKRLADQQRKLNQRVARASGGRAHHQGCRVGGLFTGMGADVSGAPCWCLPITELADFNEK